MVGPARSVLASTPVEMSILLPATEALPQESSMSFRLCLWTSYTKYALHVYGVSRTSLIDSNSRYSLYYLQSISPTLRKRTARSARRSRPILNRAGFGT